MRLKISIVVFSPDLNILIRTLNSLKIACKHSYINLNVLSELDLIDNNPLYKNKENILSGLLEIQNKTFLKVKFINSPKNGGYGYGNNLSIKRDSFSDFHLILNPDVLLSINSITNAIKYMVNNKNVGLITPHVTGLDKTFHFTCKKNPTLFDMIIRGVPGLKLVFSKRNAEYEMRNLNFSNIIKQINFPTGCFMFFRSSILREIGGFDERFFLHYEDADIGRRVSIVSQCVYLPTVKIKHIWARETHKNIKMRIITVISGIKYFIKWGSFF